MLRMSTHYRKTCLLVLPLALASCSYMNGLFAPKHPHHTVASAKPQPRYHAADFVEHLSLAELALSANPPDTDAAGTDLDVLHAYTAKPIPHKHGKKYTTTPPASVSQGVVMLECKAGGAMRHLAAPNGEDPEALLAVLRRMNAQGCTLDNLWPATVTVERGEPMTEDDMPGALPAVHERLETILHSAAHLPPLAEAKAEMQLIRVFIDAKQRDAAYLSLENAQQALAVAEKTPGGQEAVTPLLKSLDRLEKELHQAMPFTL